MVGNCQSLSVDSISQKPRRKASNVTQHSDVCSMQDDSHAMLFILIIKQ